MGRIRPYKPRNRNYKIIPPFDRFMQKFKVNPKTGCWIWTGTYDDKGYSQLFLKQEKITRKATKISGHRFSYLTLKGKIPPGMQIDHICRTRGCVNPEHLRLVTPRENVLLGIGPAAEHASKVACVNGHPFTIENTYVWKGKFRKCRECRRIKQADYHKRKISKTPHR